MRQALAAVTGQPRRYFNLLLKEGPNRPLGDEYAQRVVLHTYDIHACWLRNGQLVVQVDGRPDELANMEHQTRADSHVDCEGRAQLSGTRASWHAVLVQQCYLRGCSWPSCRRGCPTDKPRCNSASMKVCWTVGCMPTHGRSLRHHTAVQVWHTEPPTSSPPPRALPGAGAADATQAADVPCAHPNLVSTVAGTSQRITTVWILFSVHNPTQHDNPAFEAFDIVSCYFYCLIDNFGTLVFLYSEATSNTKSVLIIRSITPPPPPCAAAWPAAPPWQTPTRLTATPAPLDAQTTPCHDC